MGRGLTQTGQKIKYLTPEEIIQIHEVSMEKFGGGEPGIIKGGEGKLESMIERMKTSYFGHQPFDTLVKKTSFMFQSLLIYHPFVDGMKRTGIYSALAFLLRNEYLLISTDVEESVDFVVSVADNMIELDPEKSLDKINEWFRERLISMENTEEVIAYFEKKGKSFKCPQCSNPSVLLKNPYCRDCGLQITGFSTTIDGIVEKRDLRFERKPQQNPALANRPHDHLLRK